MPATKTGTAHYCVHAKPFCEDRRAAGVELSGGMKSGKSRKTCVTHDCNWVKTDVTLKGILGSGGSGPHCMKALNIRHS